MARVLPFVIVAVLMIYCLVEVAQANPERVRLAPRWLWVAAIAVLPGVGAIAWLAFGRPRNPAQPRKAPPRPMAPDDDQDFLRRLRDGQQGPQL